MGILAKVAAIVAVFGAANWIALSMLQKDAVTSTLGPDRSLMSDALMGVVGLASILLLVQVFKSKK
jgi:uncharacterized membrane protein YuzA (DUF378 family)